MSHRVQNPLTLPRVLLGALLLAACGGGDSPTDPTPPGGGGGGPGTNPPAPTTGQVVFWTDNAALAPIAVDVNGTSGSISSAHAAAPACGAAGAYTVTLPAGSHTFTGSNGAGFSWNGSVPVAAGGCTPWRLYSTTPPPAATGQVVFWTDNAQLAPITVQVNGVSGSITAAHAAAPACGASGAYTVTLPAGPQSFSGSNPAGLTWNGSVTVTAGACTTFRLFSSATPPPAPSTGQVAFWTDNALLAPISVKVGTLAGSITGAHTAAPACGAAGAYTVTLPAGSHAYTASNAAGLQWSGTATVTAGACTTVRLFNNAPPPAPTTGQVAFWTDNASLAPISVRVGTLTGAITGAHTAAPACGAAGAYTVTLPAGSHAYTASNAAGLQWSGTATVTAGGCTRLRLFGTSTPPPPPSTGRVMFWTDVASLAPISVSVNGGSGTIGSAYAATPTCGASGTYTVTLPAGTYAYSAANSGGSRWSGNVTVTAGQCLALKLTGSGTPPPTNPGPTCSERVQIAAMQPGQTTGWFPSRRWAGLDYKVTVGTFQYDGNERQYNVYVRNRYTTQRAWVSVGFRVGAQPANTTDRLGAIQPGGDDDATWFIEPYGRTSYLLVDEVRVGASDSGPYFCPAPPPQ